MCQSLLHAHTHRALDDAQVNLQVLLHLLRQDLPAPSAGSRLDDMGTLGEVDSLVQPWLLSGASRAAADSSSSSSRKSMMTTTSSSSSSSMKSTTTSNSRSSRPWEPAAAVQAGSAAAAAAGSLTACS